MENVEPYVKKALAEKRKMMGFGHAVYKTEDPRATHLREVFKRGWRSGGRYQVVRDVSQG